MSYEDYLDRSEWERIALLMSLQGIIERVNESGAGEMSRPKKTRR